MDKKYLINEDTLNSIAQAIRSKEDSSETIAATDFAKRIEAIEPTVEDYMRISDLIDSSRPIDEKKYTEKEVERCAKLYSFYLEMEGLSNGK
jgi:hypothetical protein